MLVSLVVILVGFVPSWHSTAQDGPVLTADPPHVEEPGEYTFTVTGSGWTAIPPLGVLACLDLVDQSTCDRDSGVVVPDVTDGSFTAQITIDVPSGGIYIGAGDFAETQAIAIKITVGTGDELPATGVNTSLLVILGAGIALAGVMVFGLSRRLRTL